jgi:serine/threonine-protein kinase HipA
VLSLRRLGYLSALTLLGAVDGEQRDYLEIAAAISQISAQPSVDLRELFLRIAFSVTVNNTDDHLRNHGFIFRDGGWRLSPLFDVNPNPDAHAARTTSIGGAITHDESIKALLEHCGEFRLEATEAHAIMERMELL